MSQDFINDLMNFNPQDLDVFKEPEKKSFNDPNFYKTNPIKFSKADDGHYRSKIRLIYNPFDVKKSVVNTVSYSMQDSNGFFKVPTKLTFGDKNCPIFKAWKQLWFDKKKDNKEFCKEIFQQREERFVLVQVLEDANQPELVGKILIWKLPKVVYDSMEMKMNPAEGSKKKPVAILDYLFGRPLELDVAPGPDDPTNPSRKQREISYKGCEFAEDPEPIIQVDGTPLFTEDEMDLISNFAELKSKMDKAKTESDRKKKEDELSGLAPQIKELYNKALEYLKKNALDLYDLVGYKDWTPAQTERVNAFLSIALQGIDPKTYVGNNPLLNSAEPVKAAEAMQPEIKPAPDDDLPF